MAHLPETGAKTAVLISDATDMQFGTELFCYKFLITNHFVPVCGTSFLGYEFSAQISGTCGHCSIKSTCVSNFQPCSTTREVKVT